MPSFSRTCSGMLVMKTSASADELVEHGPRLGLGQVERQALLVPGFQQPGEIVLAGRIARQVGQVAVGIAGAGRLDLDDVGAEVGQHGGGRGRRDEARAVQNLQACRKCPFPSRRCSSRLLFFPLAGISAVDHRSIRPMFSGGCNVAGRGSLLSCEQGRIAARCSGVDRSPSARWRSARR